MKMELADRSRGEIFAEGQAVRADYPLGYSEAELRRLRCQGKLFRELTADLLRDAGIGPGMRVLDVGCGAGDVSMIAAELVGPSGRVLGIDRSAEAVALAGERAVAAGYQRIGFFLADADDFLTDETFDAIVGRLVLLYLPDPAATLRRLSPYLRPGGIVAFQEMAMPMARSCPPGPVFERCRNWILETFRRGGFHPDMGGQLMGTFLAAGLPAPQMSSTGLVGGGEESPLYDYIAGTLRSLLPAIERLGIATAEEIDVESLSERLRQEAVASGASIMPPPLVGAWTRLPASAA